MFFPSELGSKDLNDYKNCKACSYHKSGRLQPLLYHNLTGSNFCILKGECRKSQSVNDPFQKLCIILEKSAEIWSCQCTCMVGMGETCNHVDAKMFRVEAAVRTGLTKQSCTSSANEWLSCRKDIEPTKTKDLNFDREDFAQREKKSPVASLKKKFNPLAKSDKKPLSLIDFASTLEEIVPNSILFTAVPKPKIDFVREIIVEWARETDAEVTSIESLIKLSKTKLEFLGNLDLLSIEKIRQFEVCTGGQCCNEKWYLCTKGVIAASTAHEVITKMKKVRKRGRVSIWSLKEKISGMAFVDLNIVALKHERDTEIGAVSTFVEYIKNYHSVRTSPPPSLSPFSWGV